MNTQYIFGTTTRHGVLFETVKTISDEHTNLEGFVSCVRTTDIDETTDRFRIIDKFHSTEGIDGKCYDFYTIDSHNTIIDYTKPVKQKAEQNAADIQYVAMMADIPMEEGESNE